MTEHMHRLLLRFYILCTVVSVGAFGVILGYEVHVRWALNKDFTFLGANGMLGLALVTAVQFAGLAYLLGKRS